MAAGFRISSTSRPLVKRRSPTPSPSKPSFNRSSIPKLGMSSLLFRFPFTKLLRLQLVGPGGNLALMGGRSQSGVVRQNWMRIASRSGDWRREIFDSKPSSTCHIQWTYEIPYKFWDAYYVKFFISMVVLFRFVTRNICINCTAFKS